MHYGYFDDKKMEYVITRPDTPESWSNYLGSTEYGAIITNNAGGYGFYKSGADGRFLRVRFNSVPMDQPGRYIYIRDNENSDFWSASWQPVGKPLEEYESVCRHGTAYSVFESRYSKLHTETTYFVPLDQKFEYWKLRITNESDTKRSLSVFTYCEFANNWNTNQDLVNLQYSTFIVKGSRKDNMLRIITHENLLHSKSEDDSVMQCWMAMVGSQIDGYDTSRESFLGRYNGYHNPQAVSRGKCSDSDAYGDNACGSFQSNIVLNPGESKEILIMLGVGDTATEGNKAVAEFGSVERANKELAALKDNWHSKLSSFKVTTPDKEFNSTINVWGLYNCLINFFWSRSASLIYNGERNGLGFRDSVQDILGVAAAVPEEALKRVELMLTGQLANGGAIPVIKPFAHNPGHELPPDPQKLRSDDCLWFFNAVPAIVAETGDFDFYTKVLPYADKQEDTVLGHLRRALEFNLERRGKNGLPCGLHADWNDCLRLGYKGESLFVAFQLRYGLSVYEEICLKMGKTDEVSWAVKKREELEGCIQSVAWDGEWFIWAIGEDGTVYGTKEYDEGQIYLNTQVWAVISGAASKEQSSKCMESVKRLLATEYGLMLCAPPFKKTPIDVMRSVVFNAGIKENAGIFNHTQGWGVIAECILGNGDRAYEYCRANMPAAYNDKAQIRQMEPYVQGQTTYSSYSPRAGNSRVSWLTGAASWSYFSATQHILGIIPMYEGIKINPCIPSHWDKFTVARIFRGKALNIEVLNPQNVNKGVIEIFLNNETIKDNFISVEKLKSQNDIKVLLGK
ncbi:hypothetical protein QA601_07280 [Chitinispirillales bacterium ANBcel5]|uniref:GH36-type glycosyl hydrolase domain-containing protein n=1 Tax=Cellulosispirillum alkaliphilum TaxID=3039283 RepID=UPI002A529C9A|nr:hypothetical protein [Chitinispirillales bacterium ANBcel5]